MTASYQLDKFDIRRSFDRASNSYDEMAQLQRSVGLDLFKLFKFSNFSGTVLDLGCGTGFLTRELSQFPYPNLEHSTIFALDIAMSMLEVARTKCDVNYICADIEQLPVQAGSVDWIFSNLALQWCSNLEQVFSNFRRVLMPGGQFVFSTFGPRTLHELKTAWASVDNFSHVNQFSKDQKLSKFIDQAGMQIMAMENRLYFSEYLDVMSLMKELKGIGAHNVTQGRNRALSTKTQIRNMSIAYDRLRMNGFLPATFEVIFVYGMAK